MSHSSRRRARRLSQERKDRAAARVAARQEQIRAGLRKGPRIYTRKDREDLGLRVGSKQARKHQEKKWARSRRLREQALAEFAERLLALTADLPVRPVSVEHFGGACPLTASGEARSEDGATWWWDFRFRYDRAFLEVGTRDEEYDDLVDVAHYAASRDDVTGEPYAGYLSDAELLRLLGELFTGAAPPVPGELFSERAHNTVALVNGGGDPDMPTLIRYL